ncbi:MAG: OmpH family outer membrane protein [Desulfobacterales bacterium]|nr:OmpH family outer membrane protein [Desulfobacterales bacterium]
MNRMKVWAVMVVVLLLAVQTVSSEALAGDEKTVTIATVKLKEVLTRTPGAKEARAAANKIVNAKKAAYEKEFNKDSKELEELQAQINSAVLSAEAREKMIVEFRKKGAVLQQKVRLAQVELDKLDQQAMEPVLAELHAALAGIGKEHGFTLILENSRTGLESPHGLLYADESIDITDLVVEALAARLAGIKK